MPTPGNVRFTVREHDGAWEVYDTLNKAVLTRHSDELAARETAKSRNEEK